MSDKPPFVIHVSEMADFPDAVYIGRENGRKRLKRSKWHNPYKIGAPSTVHTFSDGFTIQTADCMSRETVVRKYRRHIMVPEAGLFEQLQELTGKPLACWCRRSDEERTDDNMCHGDVLVEMWKEVHGE